MSTQLMIHIAMAMETTTVQTISKQIEQKEEVVIKIDNITWYKQMVEDYSLKYNVSSSSVWKTIGCETGYTYDKDIQSNVILSYGREQSYGLAMIHLPAHPDITKEQATNPEFAINFITSNWSKHKSWWVCAIKLKL